MPNIKDLAITKTEANEDDWLVLQDAATSETYKIKVSDFLAGLSSGGGGSGDTYFSSVALLLDIDGTSPKDSSSNNFSLTNSGATISTLSTFGASSWSFGGGSNIITSPDNSLFNLGSSDFTFEAIIYPTVVDSNPRYIFSQVGNLASNSNRGYGLNISSNNIQWYWTTNGITDQSQNFSCTLSANNWYHVAIARTGGNLSAFLDGTLLSSVSHSPTYYDSSANITIGSFGGYAADGYPQLSFNGYIEKRGLRLTRISRYSSSFTPLTEAFPIS